MMQSDTLAERESSLNLARTSIVGDHFHVDIMLALVALTVMVCISCSDVPETSHRDERHSIKVLANMDDYEIFRRGQHILFRQRAFDESGIISRLMKQDINTAQLHPMRIGSCDTVWDYAEASGTTAAVIGQSRNEIAVRWSRYDTLHRLIAPKAWKWKGGSRYQRIAVSRSCVYLLSGAQLYIYDRLTSAWSVIAFPDSITRRSAWGGFTFVESVSNDSLVIGTDAGEFGGDLILAVLKGPTMSIRVFLQSNPLLCQRTEHGGLIIAGGNYHLGISESWIGRYQGGVLSIIEQSSGNWRRSGSKVPGSESSGKFLALPTDISVIGSEARVFDPHTGIFSIVERNDGGVKILSLRRDVSFVGRRPTEPTWRGYFLGANRAMLVTPGHGVIFIDSLQERSRLIIP
jgi:hypothetical protein